MGACVHRRILCFLEYYTAQHQHNSPELSRSVTSRVRHISAICRCRRLPFPDRHTMAGPLLCHFMRLLPSSVCVLVTMMGSWRSATPGTLAKVRENAVRSLPLALLLLQH